MWNAVSQAFLTNIVHLTEGREELRKTSRTRFLGFVSFLTHLFGTMRLGNGEVMLPLVGPVYDCCELIVDNDCINEDECACLSQQVRDVARNEGACVVFFLMPSEP